ncbi:MAG: hypothetical protein GX320_03515 [Tissierellia bacterium]|nr:hypothetical protein [Tissierellia bacterium]
MLIHIQRILFILLILNILGYVLVILKEKIYLKNNMIVINKKAVTQSHLDKTDIKEFTFDGSKVKAGDEIKVVTVSKEKFKGILIGAIRDERAILLVTYGDQIKEFKIDTISKLKIISKYGKFFKG